MHFVLEKKTIEKAKYLALKTSTLSSTPTPSPH
jgi:hypothetical protein